MGEIAGGGVTLEGHMRILLLLLILYTAAEQSGEQHPSPQSSGDPSSEQKKAACHTAGLVKGSQKKEACTIVRAGKHESQIECAACGTIQACPSKSTSYSATSAKYFELVQTGTAKDVSKWVGLCETETASKKTAGFNKQFFIAWREEDGKSLKHQVFKYQGSTSMSFNKGTSKTFKVHDGKKTKNLYFTFLSSERNFNTNVPGGTGGNGQGFIVTEAKAKMMKLVVCVDDGATKTCANKKIMLSCIQAKCATALNSYNDCPAKDGATPDANNPKNLVWGTEDNCANETKAFGAMLN